MKKKLLIVGAVVVGTGVILTAGFMVIAIEASNWPERP